MPLVRVTNDQRQTRVFYDKTRRAIAVAPGKSAEINFNEGGYERARVKALAKVGPKIELLKEDDKPLANETTSGPVLSKTTSETVIVNKTTREPVEDTETEAPRRKAGRPRTAG